MLCYIYHMHLSHNISYFMRFQRSTIALYAHELEKSIQTTTIVSFVAGCFCTGCDAARIGHRPLFCFIFCFHYEFTARPATRQYCATFQYRPAERSVPCYIESFLSLMNLISSHGRFKRIWFLLLIIQFLFLFQFPVLISLYLLL